VIEHKTPQDIERMHVTGQFVGQVLAELAGLAAVGVNLLDLEHHARRRIKERGAESCYWDYEPSFGKGPFRNVVCLSVNDAVLHGLPHSYKLRDGDLLTMDMAVVIDGWAADSSSSAPRPRRICG
jgi:methionyl aminopeptidase